MEAKSRVIGHTNSITRFRDNKCSLKISALLCKQDAIILTMAKYTLIVLTAALTAAAAERINELVEMPGHDRPHHIISPQPHE